MPRDEPDNENVKVALLACSNMPDISSFSGTSLDAIVFSLIHIDLVWFVYMVFCQGYVVIKATLVFFFGLILRTTI